MGRPRKCPEEMHQRAVGMVLEWHREMGQPRGGVAHIAGQLGINKETLRNWFSSHRPAERRPSSRRSSTAHSAGSRVHRRAAGPFRGRADLPGAGRTPGRFIVHCRQRLLSVTGSDTHG